MSIQRFPLAAVKQVRQHIQQAIAVDADGQVQTWAGTNNVDNIPEPESLDDLSSVFAFGGLLPEEITAPRSRVCWSVSTVNPGAALLKLPGLRLKPSWRLVSYLYRDGDGSAGMVFAVPEQLSTTSQLERVLPTSSSFKHPPKPEGALLDFMGAIDGDRSAGSFIVASLLHRELREFGASGPYQSWTHHCLIDAIPGQARWQWQTEQPKDLTPKAKVLPDGQAVVEFFTCRVKAGIALYRHLDHYPSGQYNPKRIDKPLATVQR